jgi:uncharacterized cupin superfamily protein
MPEPSGIPHFNVHDSASFQPFPEMNGEQALLYRSPDGTRVAGSFKEAGKHQMVMPFDELIYLVGGEAHITVHGVGEVHLRPGDVCYLKQGQTVDFDLSNGFHDVTVLISDTEIVL